MGMITSVVEISSTINLCDSGMNGGSLSGATVQSHVIVESKTVLQNAKVSWVKCWLTPHFVQRINLKSNKYVTMIRVLQSGLRETGQRWVITFVTQLTIMKDAASDVQSVITSFSESYTVLKTAPEDTYFGA